MSLGGWATTAVRRVAAAGALPIALFRRPGQTARTAGRAVTQSPREDHHKTMALLNELVATASIVGQG